MRKIHWIPVLLCILLVTSLLSGCGSTGKMKSISKSDLQKYVNQLPALQAVYESHHVKFLSSYSDDKKGFLEVRRLGEHDKSLSNEEEAKLRQSIYKATGAEFPLAISVYTIDEQSGMLGKITAIDEKGRLLVVSSDKFLDNEKKMPDAAWYTMSDDAIILLKGKKVQTKDVAIGSSVKIWSEGTMLSSYPGQTSGLRLEIISEDNGHGDASGNVTGVVMSGEGVNVERSIEVDGVKYKLIQASQVLLNGKKADFSDIKVGTQVKIWFAGYELGPEQIVTKVVIE